MAKLNGVKTVAETIEYAGVTYRQTLEGAKAGDIIRFTALYVDDCAECVTVGEYYAVDSVDNLSDAQITDDCGGYYDTYGDTFTVFRKTGATESTVVFGGKTYAKVDRPVKSGDVIRWGAKGTLIDVVAGNLYLVKATAGGSVYFADDEGDKRFEPLQYLKYYDVYEEVTAETTPASPEYVIHDGKVYAKAAPGTVAKTGDTVMTIASDAHGWPTGIIAIKGDGRLFRSETKTTLNGGCAGQSMQMLDPHEYTVLTPVVTEKRKPAIGERVIIVNERESNGCYTNGDVGTVARVDGAGDPIINGRVTYYSEYLVLTEAAETPPATEVKRRAEAGDRIKIVAACGSGGMYRNGDVFTASERSRLDTGVYVPEVTVPGRNSSGFIADHEYVVLTEEPQPKRLTVGDYAKVVKLSTHNYALGTLIKITVDDGAYDIRPYSGERPDGTRGNWLRADELEPATEAEFNAAKPQPAADPRDAFPAGDKVRLLSGGGTSGLRDYTTGEVYTVLAPKAPFGGSSVQITGGGQPTAYALPDQLEKVAEEKPRLSVGDYAKTLVETDVPAGAIVKIVMDDGTDLPYQCVVVGGNIADEDEWDWYSADQLEPVDAETVKWAAIGREVNEFRRGDIVEIKNPCCAPLKAGDYVEVQRDSRDNWSVAVTERGWLVSVTKLVTPVEQRFDTPKAA